jgi:predicted O-methyltransferase YrrM
MTSDYKFTQDWFHWAPEVWEKFIPLLPGRERMLELGAYEGRSTAWIVEHMLEDGGVLLSVDTWQGAEEHVAAGADMGAVENNFDHNVRILNEKYECRTILKFKKTSYEALASLAGGPPFDFIYIDASHTAPDVLTDACVAWPLLKDNGIMVFDDYLWGDIRDILHRPKVAVDAFVNIFSEQLKPVHLGYQYIIRKEK